MEVEVEVGLEVGVEVKIDLLVIFFENGFGVDEIHDLRSSFSNSNLPLSSRNPLANGLFSILS